MRHNFFGSADVSYCKECDVEIRAPWPLLDLAEEVAEATEAAIARPDFDTTARVVKALEAWRRSVPPCKRTDR